ncbi:MAG: hypothetical protein RJR37_15015 [Peptococcaceae bacterium MAG4]|jgi:hypothetical protein|nr:hypothetical protein [Peptococcaceae bacterium MAG4]
MHLGAVLDRTFPAQKFIDLPVGRPVEKGFLSCWPSFALLFDPRFVKLVVVPFLERQYTSIFNAGPVAVTAAPAFSVR